MSHYSRPARRFVLAGVAVLLAAATGLAGCSSDTGDDGAGTSSSSAETGAPTGDVCEAVATAQSSLDALVGTSVVQEGTDTVKERYASFESDVQLLLESGRAEFAPETAAVKASLATLQGALTGLQQDPTAADAALIKPSLQAIKTSTEELIAAVESTC